MVCKLRPNGVSNLASNYFWYQIIWFGVTSWHDQTQTETTHPSLVDVFYPGGAYAIVGLT